MANVSEWTEDDVLSLPIGENDTFERKGARLLDLTLPHVKEGDVLGELAKQLSAFANTGGGQIVYGLTDAGAVDNGGIARTVKSRQSTKEWLEDVIPNLTDFEIVGFNVYEILPRAAGSSAIAPDKSLYIVDVQDSERAPHQSKADLKYYVRLGGKSRPASHRLIEDIRNRARHPSLEVHDLRITNAGPSGHPGATTGLASEFQLNVHLRFGIRNIARVRAANACLQLSATVPLSMSLPHDEYLLRQGAEGTVLMELKGPVYPGMGVILACLVHTPAAVRILPQGEFLTLTENAPAAVELSVTTFADSAPARRQDFNLSTIDPEGRLAQVLAREVQNIRLAGRHGPPPHTGVWS